MGYVLIINIKLKLSRKDHLAFVAFSIEKIIKGPLNTILFQILLSFFLYIHSLKIIVHLTYPNFFREIIHQETKNVNYRGAYVYGKYKLIITAC
jgi:hypothetical protein